VNKRTLPEKKTHSHTHAHAHESLPRKGQNNKG